MSEFALTQSQSLQQSLSPQMRQSLELLQSSNMELQQILRQTLETNPVLELGLNEQSLEALAEDHQASEETANTEWDDEEREYAIIHQRNLGNPDDLQAHRDLLFDNLVAPTTLSEHLRQQLGELDLSPQLAAAATVVIGSLDDRGFLTQSLAELAQTHHFPLAKLEQALKITQGLDPSGVGARDLAECLLIQLVQLGLGKSLEATLVKEHLRHLERHEFSKICAKLNLTEPQLHEAISHIAQLNFSPGSQFDPTHNPEITPDLIVELDQHGEWLIHSPDEFTPTLHINQDYKALIASNRADSKTRAYLREKIRDARSLMRALEQRSQTLLLIGHQIAKRQGPALTNGLAALAPMTMIDIAEALELHPTTISRAVNSKYLLCPAGLFELRAFFSSGFTSASGQSFSNQKIKQTLSDLIAKEDPKAPLTDEKLEDLLKAKGLRIARRTIAKYREQLGIPPTHQRRHR